MHRASAMERSCEWRAGGKWGEAGGEVARSVCRYRVGPVGPVRLRLATTRAY